MSNDKTLATVKHGGCVQLGGGLLPCPFCGESLTINGAGDGVHSRDSTCILAQQVVVVDHEPQVAAWNRRALSAQPSPGGQGDAIGEALNWLRATLDCKNWHWDPDQYEAAEFAYAAALAASQPVGEPARLPSHTVDGELSVASAIDQVLELFPSSGRAALQTLAGLFTHPTIYRYATPPAQAVDLGTGVQAIACERERQLRVEGFSPACDAHYIEGELARAATAYAQLAAMDLQVGTRSHIASHEPPFFWPWAPEWWKPVNARRDLVRAGALIAAQIDLIDSHAVGNG